MACTYPEVYRHKILNHRQWSDLCFKLAKKNNVKLLYSSPEELDSAKNFTDLQSFLDIYFNCTNVLIEVQDFYDLTMIYYI